MSYDDQSWEYYLSRRPSLNKWLQCSEQDSFFQSRVSFMQDRMETGGETEYGRKEADLDDGEALAYFVYLGIDDGLLINSNAVKHLHQPSINFEEANLIDKMKFPYIDLICVRETDEDPNPGALSDSMVFTGHILDTINYYRSKSLPHIVWDTEQDLVRTVIRYKSYCNLFKTSYDAVIDSDYLENYLLADRPIPIEIGGEAWHDMAVRFIDKFDEDNPSLGYNFIGSISYMLVSCFLTRSPEDLTFMETAYDLFFSVYKDLPEDLTIHSGMLDPKVFDLLREYGAEFTKPLLESVLSDMNPVEEKRTS